MAINISAAVFIGGGGKAHGGLDPVPVMTGITISHAPNKVEYEVGEQLDLSGLVVSAVYDNGSKKVITGYTIGSFDSSTPGVKIVLINYNGFTTSFSVTVLAVRVVSISITSLPAKVTYEIGEELDLTGMIVLASYSDGHKETVTGYTVSGFSSATSGAKVLTVTYAGKLDLFEIIVKAPPIPEVTGILIKQLPTKTLYILGESFDATGISVVKIYSNGTEEAIKNSDLTFTGDIGPYVIGSINRDITVTWGAYSKLITVHVLLSIKFEMTAVPTKTEYNLNEVFDYTGMTGIVTYYSGELTRTIAISASNSNMLSIAPANWNQSDGTKSVAINYTDPNSSYPIVTASNFNVTVVDPAISGVPDTDILDEWSFNKFNTDVDREVIIGSVHNNQLKLNNFAYNKMSGYGGYYFSFREVVESGNYFTTSLLTNTKVIYSYVKSTTASSSIVLFDVLGWEIGVKDGDRVSFKIKCNIPESVTKLEFIAYDNVMGTLPQHFKKVLTTGINELDFTMPDNGAFLVRISGEVIDGLDSLEMELLPVYSDALVFDGVDDYCTGQVAGVSLGREKGVTIIMDRGLKFKAEGMTLNLGYFDSTRNTLFEEINQDSTAIYNKAFVGSSNTVPKDKVLEDGISYMTSKTYNNIVPISPGSAEIVDNVTLHIGCAPQAVERFNKMHLRKLVIYNRDLTEAEINNEIKKRFKR